MDILQSSKKANVQKKRQSRVMGIFTDTMITKRVAITINHIGDNIKQVLENKIAFDIEGKCIVEGYVKPQSCKVVSYSSGQLSGSDVIFDVIIECQVCCPVEGMHIDCIAKNITETAGIKAEIDDVISPVIIYLARDHHYKNVHFNNINIGDKIKARVIGQRFELNDTYISIIAELIEDKASKYAMNKPKKLVFKE
jgi:exosome complex RNA-binding protein Csl4